MLSPHFSPFAHGTSEARCLGLRRARRQLEWAGPGHAILTLVHQPYPKLKVTAKGRVSDTPREFETIELTLGEARCSIGAGGRTRIRPSKRNTKARWVVEGVLDLPLNTNETRIGHLVGHLYNFSQCLGGSLVGVYPHISNYACRSTWNVGPWVIEIDSIKTDSTHKKDIEKNERFALSAVVFIRKEKGKLFGAKEAADLCHFLELAFAFIEGADVGPSLVAGRRKEDLFFWYWPGPRLRSNKGRRQNWSFQHYNTRCMEVLAPMWATWNNPGEPDWLTRAVPIYVESGRDDIPWDVRIMVAQTGLEMMAALILVEKDKVMKSAEFKGAHTAQKIRKLVEHLGLSVKVPGWSKCLPLSKKGDLIDAIVEVRNEIIHPTRTNRGLLKKRGDEAIYDAWGFFMEYFELSILYAIGYTGRYASSCFEDDFPVVPWVFEETNSNDLVNPPVSA